MPHTALKFSYLRSFSKLRSTFPWILAKSIPSSLKKATVTHLLLQDLLDDRRIRVRHGVNVGDDWNTGLPEIDGVQHCSQLQTEAYIIIIITMTVCMLESIHHALTRLFGTF